MSADGFGRLLRSEWTKLRTVPGWVLAVLLSAVAVVGLGLLPGAQGSCGRSGPGSECVLPVGPEGEEVTDRFTFVHKRLTGDGVLTARVTSLTGRVPRPPEAGDQEDSRLMPWAKAGLIVKADTVPGSAYAAVMLTGGHGVRMQHNYVHDIAGSPATTPRWLRLTRTGETVVGEESADGTSWTVVGSARLPGLPSTVEIGLLTTSPQYAEQADVSFGLPEVMGGPTSATATFDQVAASGALSGDWAGDQVGGSPTADGVQRDTFAETRDGFTLSGSGDIAPAVAGSAGIGVTITQTLVGTFAGLILIVVLAAMFVTTEYRRGLIRTTLAASPRRGRVLAAKAIVMGAVAFVLGLVVATVVIAVGQPVLRSAGAYVHPATTFTEVRVVLGTAALLAVAAVLALALGSLLRRSATAVTVGVVTIVLPYLLAMSVLPPGAGAWVLRLTPAAAFALQQTGVRYDQVDNLYTPPDGYFPLAPWAGFAVLCGWTAVALGLATYRFRRNDA